MPDGGKTFTHTDVDRILADRLPRERKNRHGAELLKAFEEWKKSLKTEAEKTEQTAREFSEEKATDDVDIMLKKSAARTRQRQHLTRLITDRNSFEVNHCFKIRFGRT